VIRLMVVNRTTRRSGADIATIVRTKGHQDMYKRIGLESVVINLNQSIKFISNRDHHQHMQANQSNLARHTMAPSPPCSSRGSGDKIERSAWLQVSVWRLPRIPSGHLHGHELAGASNPPVGDEGPRPQRSLKLELCPR
jgi:hypothetical protein